MSGVITWVKTHLLQHDLWRRNRSPHSPLSLSHLSRSDDAARTASISDSRSLSGSPQAASCTNDSNACEAEIQDISACPAQAASQEPEPVASVPAQEVFQHSEEAVLTEDHPHHEEVLSLRFSSRASSRLSCETAFDRESEISTLCSMTSWHSPRSPPYPRPTTTEEWFKTFTAPGAPFDSVYFSAKRMAEFHQFYPFFDFSGPQIIDMELAAEEQPFDVQVYFAIIGVVSLVGPDKEFWCPGSSVINQEDGGIFRNRWMNASAEERNKWLTKGEEVLRARLADGTALKITYPSQPTAPAEPFPWADSRLSYYPQNITWDCPDEHWRLYVDGEVTLPREEESELSKSWCDPSWNPFFVTDRYSLHGLVFLSNIRIPLPAIDREREWLTLSAVWRSYRGHPGPSIKCARSRLDSEWDLEEAQPEYEQALRAMLLLQLCENSTIRTSSIKPWQRAHHLSQAT